ncbi:MAG TPA: 3-hydroxyacyl-CoA dehydrogenase NAD-binding domain-containing protein [Chitinophagaceae bacterium]|nr:3-hydroxyacyl-CoA dehydrogenase NAD-binding domain-containing protein [Chitinophagaceae bacterium]
MYNDAINTICVCGAGTMGSGIAQLAAVAGFETVLFDVNEDMLQKGRKSIEGGIAKLVEKNKITEHESRLALQQLHYTNNIAGCRARLVIEAIIEDKAAKTALFNDLASNNDAGTILATNTSSISVTEIAEAVEGPGRIAGMHFFNPAPVMKLVEVVKTQYTAEPVIDALIGVARRMGKQPVVCKDAPGFIVNRIARNYYLEALKMVEDGKADIAIVDALMEATGFKMGPFRLMDLIGIDVNYSVSNIVWEALGKPERLKPSALQKKMVGMGKLGRKTGKGFYEENGLK